MDQIIEGKKAKYLMYAAGEIALIIAGILIALQIDGWKEHRLNKEHEKYYVQRLLEDFEFNRNEAQRIIDFSDFQSSNAELLIKSMSSELSAEEQVDWLYALNHTWFLPHISYDDDTWNELKYTGKLELITNKDLIAEINTFYSREARIKSLETEWGGFNLSYRELVNEVIDDELKVEILEGMGDTQIAHKIDRPVDVRSYIETLRDIPGIAGLVRDIQINREVGRVHHEELKASIDDIILAIRNELDSPSS